MRDTDTLHLIDPDTVEMKNTARQIFIPREVGRSKAEVIAERVRRPNGPKVEAYVTRATVETLNAIANEIADYSSILLIGAVDSREARRGIWTWMAQWTRSGWGHPVLWIDAGNDLRSGQVLVQGTWPVELMAGYSRLANYLPKYRAGDEVYERIGSLRTIEERQPDLLDPAKTPVEDRTPDCGDRPDGQSLAANVLGAALTISYAAAILEGHALSTGGSYFNTVAGAAQPIPLVGCQMSAEGYGDRVKIAAFTTEAVPAARFCRRLRVEDTGTQPEAATPQETAATTVLAFAI